jgi:branched-chain amino acid transport system permease protein
MAYLAQQLVNGVHLGALYALLAFGYALAHSVLKRASFAHGALFAFAGQLAILFTGLAWQTFWLVYPAALALGCVIALGYTAGASWLTASWVLAPMRRAAPNTVIAATLGVLLFLSELVRIASGSRMPWLSPFLNSVIVLGGSNAGFTVTTTPIKLVSTGMSAALIAAGSVFLARSRTGLAWRAVAQDELAAELMGVDGHAVFLGSMVAAGLLAGFAGVLAAWHYGNIDFATGMAFAVKILFVASLGGLSTPALAACGGMAVGVFETLWDGWFPSVWRDAATYGLLCALLVATRRSSRIDD